MEINNFIIVSGTIFTLLLIFLAAIIIISSQKKRAKLHGELQDFALRKQKEISKITLESQESERQRLGMELHDGLGPSFVAMRINIETIQQLIDKKEYDKIENIAQNTQEGIADSIQMFSNISRLLYPVILKRHGLQEAIKDAIYKFNSNNKTEFVLNYNLSCNLIEIKDLTIYRVCQELCNNAVKHAQASTVILNLSENARDVVIEYRDDGVGFDLGKAKDGIGLNSIKGRIGAIGGMLEFHSNPKEGVQVNISIPKKEDDGED